MYKIMLLEDDVTMLSLLHTLLEIEGYQVSHTLEYGSVLDSIRKEDPDLVILDVNLREINGLDVLESVRNDKELKDLVVIMSSGMDLREECREKGANDFILKPYMPDELVQKIEKFVNE